MRKIFSISILVNLLILLTFTGCESDDPVSVKDQVINTVTSGTWRITLYDDSGKIETSNYAGFNFTFGPNSVLTAVGNGQTIVGTWSVTNSSSSGSSSSDLDFNIFFASPEKFAELSDDWDIIERTNTKIRLIDVSGGNGGTDYLTFEKN